MTLREKAIVELYTGYCMCLGEERKAVYELAEEVMGRPIFTHELNLSELQTAVKPLFIELCKE